MEPDFAREAVVGSLAKTYSLERVEKTLDGTPVTYVPVYQKCDPDPISFVFGSSLLARVSKYLWAVLNLYTLRTVVIHIYSA